MKGSSSGQEGTGNEQTERTNGERTNGDRQRESSGPRVIRARVIREGLPDSASRLCKQNPPTLRGPARFQPWQSIKRNSNLITSSKSHDVRNWRLNIRSGWPVFKDKPSAKRIWFNDLQGAPSACGCGHPLSCWTADYGPIKTATTLDENAAAEFIAAVKQLSVGAEIIPIFVGECEEEDMVTLRREISIGVCAQYPNK